MELIIDFLLLGILFLVFGFFFMQAFNIMFRGFAPFVSSHPKVIRRIIDEMNIGEDMTVYELGCGRAGFLRAVKKRFPQVKAVGIEYALVPYLVAQIQNGMTLSKLDIRRSNIFQVKLAEADMIYCYLNTQTMEGLRRVFEKECKPGCLVVSYRYPITGLEPERTLDVRDGKDKVFFYKF